MFVLCTAAVGANSSCVLSILLHVRALLHAACYCWKSSMSGVFCLKACLVLCWLSAMLGRSVCVVLVQLLRLRVLVSVAC